MYVCIKYTYTIKNREFKNKHAYIHSCIHTYIHTYVLSIPSQTQFKHTHATHTHIHALMHIAYTHKHKYKIQAYSFMYTYIHTKIHTYRAPFSCNKSSRDLPLQQALYRPTTS